MNYLVYAVMCYLLLDFALGIIYGRCMLPGLKCSACRREVR